MIVAIHINLNSPTPLAVRYDGSIKGDVRRCESDEEFICDFGEPTNCESFEKVRDAVGRGESLFGRSWIHFRKDTRELSIAVDRVGLFPLLVYHNQQQVIIATRLIDVADVLGAKARLCGRGVLQLLAFGQFLTNGTLLDGVEYLGAGRIIKINSDGIATASRPRIAEKEPFDRQRALDAFVEAVDARLRHSQGGIIPLSGGLDSRLMLAAAISTGRRPDTLCFGDRESADLTIARQLAKVAGVTLHEGCYGEPEWKIARALIAREGDGQVSLHHGHVLCPIELNERLRGNQLLTGTGGEVFRGFYYDRGIPGLGLLDSRYLKNWLLGRAQRYAVEGFDASFIPFCNAFPQCAAIYRKSLLETLSPYAQQAHNAADYLNRTYLGVRVSRFVIGGQRLLDATYGRSHPFLDEGVLNTWLGMPARWRVRSRYHRWAIKKLAPNLADVTWDQTMRPLSDGLRWYERYTGLAIRLGWKVEYAKKGMRLADYGAWTDEGDWSDEGACFDKQNLHRNLDSLTPCDMDKNEFISGIEQLLSGPGSIHAKGVLGAAIRFNSYISNGKGREAPARDAICRTKAPTSRLVEGVLR